MDPYNTQIEEPSIFEDVPVHVEYATAGQRFLNWIIDLIVIRFLLAGIFMLLGFGQYPIFAPIITFSDGIINFQLANFTFDALILTFIYTIIEGATKGYSLSKLITGTRVVQQDTAAAITWKDALIRSLSRMVPFEPLSGLMAYPWHDRWSKTIVIRTR